MKMELNLDEKDTTENDTIEKDTKEARDFLNGIAPSEGLQLSIYRSRPAWVSTGWLETIDFGPGTDFSLDWLRETHGGGTYVLRVLSKGGKFCASSSVKIAGDPKIYGQIVTAAAAARGAQAERVANELLQPSGHTAPNTPSFEMTALVKMLMENLNQTQRDNLSLLTTIMKSKDSGRSGGDTAQEIRTWLSLVDEIRKQAAPAATDTNEGVLGLVGLLNTFLANRKEPETQQTPPLPVLPRRIGPPPPVNLEFLKKPAPVVAAPAIAAPAIVAPAVVVPAVAAPTNTFTPEGDQLGDIDPLENDDPTLAEEIADLSVEEIADLIREVLEVMPVEKVTSLMAKIQPENR